MPKTDPDPAEPFSPIEEEFFRAGDAISAAAPSEAWADHEAAPARTSVWSRLFKRTPRPVIVRARAATGV